MKKNLVETFNSARSALPLSTGKSSTVNAQRNEHIKSHFKIMVGPFPGSSAGYATIFLFRDDDNATTC